MSEGEELDEEVEVSCNIATRPLLPVTRPDLFITVGTLCGGMIVISLMMFQPK